MDPGRRRAAVNGGSPWAIKPAAIPASTSPDPAVASEAGAWTLMTARPSGAATTVSAPLSRTVAPLRRAADRTRSTLPATAPPGRGNRRRNSPSCGVSKTGLRIAENRRDRVVGKNGHGVGIQHQGPAGAQRRRAPSHACVHSRRSPGRSGSHCDASPQSGRSTVLVLSQIAGLRCAIDASRRLGRSDGDEACPCPPRAPVPPAAPRRSPGRRPRS